MNDILGARIKTLRQAKGFTQEQFALKMNCSRQEYAGLEKGLIDISYASITTIAQVLGTKIDEITSVVNNENIEEPIFIGSSDYGHVDKFLYINNMLDTFYAHRKLYNSVRQDELGSCL